MEEKKYLSEENYEKSKKKIKTIALTILLLGLLIGGGLIAIGLIKSNQLKLNEEQISAIQNEIDNYHLELSSLNAKQHKELSDNGLSEKYYNYDYEIDKIEDKIDALEEKLDPNLEVYIPLYMLGAFIILAACMYSFQTYFVSKGREIAAFTTQQTMPVAKERIDEMAPTVGNAAGEIAKGIKKGLKDDKK